MSQESENELSIFIKQIKSFRDSFFEYLNKDSDEGFAQLKQYFKDNKISENKQKFIT